MEEEELGRVVDVVLRGQATAGAFRRTFCCAVRSH
jgi:hypothetical protein